MQETSDPNKKLSFQNNANTIDISISVPQTAEAGGKVGERVENRMRECNGVCSEEIRKTYQ